MKEMNLKKSFELSLTQFECLACKKKIYVNIEDVDSTEEAWKMVRAFTNRPKTSI